jgi:hypothetical protein
VLDVKPTFDVYLNDAWRVRKEVSSGRNHQDIHPACTSGAVTRLTRLAAGAGEIRVARALHRHTATTGQKDCDVEPEG